MGVIPDWQAIRNVENSNWKKKNIYTRAVSFCQYSSNVFRHENRSSNHPTRLMPLMVLLRVGNTPMTSEF
jgi:hypothetical protein